MKIMYSVNTSNNNHYHWMLDTRREKEEIHRMKRKDMLEGTMSEHRGKCTVRNGDGGVLGHQSDHLCGGRREETMGELLVNLLVVFS